MEKGGEIEEEGAHQRLNVEGEGEGGGEKEDERGGEPSQATDEAEHGEPRADGDVVAALRDIGLEDDSHVSEQESGEGPGADQEAGLSEEAAATVGEGKGEGEGAASDNAHVEQLNVKAGEGADEGGGRAGGGRGGGGGGAGGGGGGGGGWIAKYKDEDDSMSNWRKHKKHVFIMSSAGKPIFSRYGDEEKLNPMYGVMCSLVNFISSSDGDTIRTIFAGKHKIVFLVRGPIYLVAASRTGEPAAHVARQLQFLYTQLVSILTRKGLEHVFKKRHGFDLRNLLGSSGEQVLSNLSCSMDAHKASSDLPLQTSLSYLLGAPSCLRLPMAVRQQVNKALLSVKNPNLIYSVLIAGHKLVQFVRPRKTALWAEDLLIIINLVNSSSSFRSSDGTWTPLCLPLYSPDANVFAYICFLSKYGAPDVCMVLITSKDDEFFNLSNSKHSVASQLQESSALGQIQYALRKTSFSIDEIESGGYGIARDVHHFVYVSTAVNQLICPSFTSPYNDKREQQNLLRDYQAAHWRLHKRDRMERMHFIVSDSHSLLVWVDRDLELFVSLGPLTSRGIALAACSRLIKWVKKEEQSLFITPQMW